jgi:putative NIF3 family GTP cyclohydrolase 1 type 2
MPVTANDILEHLLDRSPWVDRTRTVDTVKAGDPTRAVKKAAVAWISSMANLRAAVRMGCDLFVTHEPTFYNHFDDPADPLRRQEPAAGKQAFLDQAGMCVFRCHDCWDRWPAIGIGDSWAAWLGLTSRIARDAAGYCSVYEIDPTPLGAFAAGVAAACRPMGQHGVQVIGEMGKPIRRPAIGTGCAVPDADLVAAGADVIVATYDGASQWQMRQRLCDLGVSLVCLEHGTSEKPGMMNLVKYLERTLPGLSATYVDADPPVWSVGAGGGPG